MVWLAFLLNTVWIPLVFAHGGCGSIQSAVDAAREGSTVTLPGGCVYREAVTITKPLTLVGQPGTELRGSDAWPEWRRSGAVWVSERTVPSLPRVTAWEPLWTADPMAGEPEQVFVDGAQLEQVMLASMLLGGEVHAQDGDDRALGDARCASDERRRTTEGIGHFGFAHAGANEVRSQGIDDETLGSGCTIAVSERRSHSPRRAWALPSRPGAFALDANRHVVLGADPRGHSVEVTTRSRVLTVAASGVTVRGITVQHGAPGYQEGLVSAHGVDRLTLDHVTVVASATSNVVVRGGAHHHLTHVVSQQAGMLGLDLAGDWGGAPMTDLLVEGSTVEDSNTEWFNIGWHAGGVKIVQAHGVAIRRNTIRRVEGTGIWLDVDIQNAEVSTNTVTDATAVGIFYEDSPGPARITGNLLERIGQYGGANWTTCNATWTGNTFRDMATGLMSRWQDDRADKPVGCRNASNVQSGNTFEGVDVPTAGTAD